MRVGRKPRTAVLAAILGASLGAPLVGCAGAPGRVAPSPTDASGSPPAASTRTPSSGAPPTGPSASASDSATSRPASPTPSPSPPACADAVAELNPAEQVGQLLMVAVSSGGVTAGDARVLADARAGSVLLLGNSDAGVEAVRRLGRRIRAAARTPNDVQPLLAADQEGGQVQRLQGPGFTRIPSAREQATWTDATLRRRAEDWGAELREAGIDADLAPVADVVPAEFADQNAPIGRLDRGFGPDPREVAGKVGAVVAGMDEAGRATAVKHFPGLGRVRGNTDFANDVVDDQTTRRDRDLAGFEAAVEAGTDMVMVASATYRRIDPDHRAALSSTVIEDMIRGDLGFDGVVVSDDLSAAAFRGLTPRQRILRFLRAGGDLAIVGRTPDAVAMAMAVREEMDGDPDFAATVREHARRVLVLKDRRGLARC